MGSRLTEAMPVVAVSLAEILAEEMIERGWTIEDAGGRMNVCGPARDTLCLALAMAVQSERLILDAAFLEGLARAFDVSPEFFGNIHRQWIEHPGAKQAYAVPDSLFGPWLRQALGQSEGGADGE